MEKSPLKQEIKPKAKTTKIDRPGIKEKETKGGLKGTVLPTFTVTYSEKEEKQGLVGPGGQSGIYTHTPPLNMEGTVQRAFDPNYDIIEGDKSPVGQYRQIKSGKKKKVRVKRQKKRRKSTGKTDYSGVGRSGKRSSQSFCTAIGHCK